MNPRGLDLRVYLVTDTVLCADRGVPATVAAAVRGGATMVQLRDHHLSDEDFLTLGRAVRDVLTGTGVPLVVDDRVHLVAPMGADGVHLGQQDMCPAQARELLGADALIGLSVSTQEQLGTAQAAGRPLVDYLGVGPVWATSTKPDHDTPIGPEGAAALAAASPWPVVAIGGIDGDRVPVLRSSGVAGVAVVSAVCAADDPAAATTSLRAAWEGRR